MISGIDVGVGKISQSFSTEAERRYMLANRAVLPEEDGPQRIIIIFAPLSLPERSGSAPAARFFGFDKTAVQDGLRPPVVPARFWLVASAWGRSLPRLRFSAADPVREPRNSRAHAHRFPVRQSTSTSRPVGIRRNQPPPARSPPAFLAPGPEPGSPSPADRRRH